MYNRRYEKVFLMLRQETAGYALGKRPPWGSCVMEIKNGKGRLHLTAQGLRRGGYAVYVMLGEEPAETLFCGELHPDGREGRAELKWDFLPDALGHGKKAEDFRAVLLLAGDGKDGRFSAPLTAFFGEKTDWKREFAPNRPKQAEEPARIQAAETAALPTKAAEPTKKAATAPEVEKTAGKTPQEQDTEGYHGNFSGLLAKFRQELEELEETGVLTPEETERIRRIGTQEDPKPAEDTPEPAAGSLPEAFGGNPELEPFGDGLLWKCLAPEELALLPGISLRWRKRFFFLLPCRRYRHFVLREEGDALLLGLPAVYREEDRAEAEAYGFLEFRPVDEELGYWLARLARPAASEKNARE